LGPVDGAGGSSHVDRDAVAAEGDGDDLSVAAEPADGGHREWETVFGLADPVGVERAAEEGEVHEHADLGEPLLDSAQLRLDLAVVVVVDSVDVVVAAGVGFGGAVVVPVGIGRVRGVASSGEVGGDGVGEVAGKAGGGTRWRRRRCGRRRWCWC
jgi:hypothetical protein